MHAMCSEPGKKVIFDEHAFHGNWLGLACLFGK